MGLVSDLAEQLWTGARSTVEQSPFAPVPAIEEVAERAAFVSSFANVTAVDTDDGLVLIDAGGFLVGASVFGMLRTWSARRLNAAVYTHGHVDHVFGVERFDAESRERGWPKVRVLAHEGVPARFERYRLTGGYNACINSRQFGIAVKWPEQFRFPDETYRAETRLDVGGERFELHPARGETDDHTWVWLPRRKLLCTGDLFIWATPNAGNPQKVQRYPREWAQALRQMAALGAEVLCPGHGLPIFGAARIRQALDDTAELLEILVEETLARMNAGLALDVILREVKAPERLLERPYLRPIYDDPQFIVRNVWRQFGGWWDGNPARLKPPPDGKLAGEVAALAGGAARLIERAQAIADAGDLALACQLAEWAAQAAPNDAAMCRTRAALYRRRAG
ncbi:MAG TPA: alkyl sulfatase dimerization domain-containing protein, partial [Polyangia bacterium]|nr:alkyl sulfatase dimerization domain-containing protein [Polyangia bacterium]